MSTKEIAVKQFCRVCCRSESILGVASRPGKTIGTICLRCWEKSKKSLANGHNYSWSPIVLDKELPHAP